MNKKGFAISVVLYTMVILVVGIFYLLLGIVRHRYTVGNDLKGGVIDSIKPGEPIVSKVLSDTIDDTLDFTTDTSGNRFVVGTSVNDNYVWYSGKLWRIIAVNNDGTVKLVTNGNVSAVAWDISSTSANYENSQIRAWLNNEFEKTLYNAEDLLVNATWDCSPYKEYPSEKITPTKTVTDKVGLLSIYEIMMAEKSKTGMLGIDSIIDITPVPIVPTPSDSIQLNSFLINDYSYWLLNPSQSDGYVWYVDYTGYPANYSTNKTTTAYGVRPSIILKSGVKINGGTGLKNNPYTLEGDIPVAKSDTLLNKRMSGEYVKFNDTLYRIVGVEEVNGKKLTKVTMADYNINKNSLGYSVFGNSASDVEFNLTTGVGKYLLDWYNADSTNETYKNTYINEFYKNMIATGEDGVKWYLGDGYVDDTVSYTASKKGKTIVMPIGLGYYGEMFASQFGDGYGRSQSVWLMTKYSASKVRYNRNDGWAYYYSPTESTGGVRPFFYLESEVKISSGNGQASDPYDIKMATITSTNKVLSDVVEEKNDLTEPDADGTKFVEGEDVLNYLWYSGKLWRILSINDDGSIRLVTQGCVSSVAWNSTSSTDYKTSQIRSWLNNEFYGTLYDADNLLIGTTLDYTLYDTFPTSKSASTNVINNEKIGLLTIYEYMMSGGTTTKATSKTFLNTAYYWWTASPNVNNSKIWYVSSENSADVNSVMTNYGVRPTITLRSGVRISGGTGEKNNPFRIAEDKPIGTNSESLNNRISGEYINFNNRIYRIVGTEVVNGKKLTKITMADYNFNKNTIATVAFGASYSESTFTLDHGIGKYLENWYQANSLSETYKDSFIMDGYKAMIATKEEGVVWYKGPDSGGTDYDYTLAKTGTPISATIGLNRYGEMFSGQFGDGWETSYSMSWLITKSSDTLPWRLNGNCGVYSYTPNNALGVRPSMYLKSNVKITSGTGMPHDPYQITM